MTEKEDIAYRLNDSGIQLVPFTKAKEFNVINWKQYQTERQTDAFVTKWFTDDQYNVGVITGEISGVTVIDFDPRADGADPVRLRVLTRALTGGEGYGVTTPSGGWHIWFKYNPDVKQTAGLIPGVDIRNDGGLVGYYGEAKYSKSINGVQTEIKGRYTPRTKCTLGDLPTLDLATLNATIQNIFPELKVRVKEKYQPVVPTSGSRNNTLVQFVGKLYSDGNTPDQVADMARALNRGSEKPLPEEELEAMLKGKERWFEASKSLSNIDKIDLSQAQDEYEIVSSLSIEDQVRKRVAQLKFLPTGFDRFDESMKGGFLDNDFVILTGETKAGKTEVSINMIRNMEAYHPLYLTLEDPIVDQQVRKLFLYGKIETKKYHVITGKKKEFTLEWITLKIKECIDKNGTKIVFIDNLDWIEGANDYKASMKIVQSLKAITETLNICIVLLAHVTTNKDGARYGLTRPDPQKLKMGSHLSQTATKVVTVWRVAISKDKNTTIPVGYTTLTLALARFPGDSNAESYLKFDKGDFIEIPESVKDNMLADAESFKSTGKKQEEFAVPKTTWYPD